MVNAVHQSAGHFLAHVGDFLGREPREVYLVGGFVRDALLRKPTTDIDLTVAGDALPLARSIADFLGGSYVALDEAKGVARVVVEGQGQTWHLDLATMQGTLEQDLARRDFTVDAMAVDLGIFLTGSWTHAILDPYHGRSDLQAHLIRQVGRQVFLEDPLRMLRAVRLAAQLGFTIEPQTQATISRDRHLLNQASPERVREELCRILAIEGCLPYLRLLDTLGLLTLILPELEAARGVEQPKEHYWDVFDHCIETVGMVEKTLGHMPEVPWDSLLADHFSQEVGDGQQRSTILKLACLLHDIAKPQTKTVDAITGRTRFFGHSKMGAEVAVTIMQRLHFSRRCTRLVEKMIEHHLRPSLMASEGGVPTPKAIYRFFQDAEDAGVDTLFLSLADFLAAKGPLLEGSSWPWHLERIKAILKVYLESQTTASPSRLVDGHDLMQALDMPPGRELGRLLEAIREAQATGEVTTPQQALAYARELQKLLHENTNIA